MRCLFMNINNHAILKSKSHSNFNEEVINPFLDKSKSEYPFSIVISNSERVDISLFKECPIPYDFAYEDAIKDIGEFLKEIVSEYGFNEIIFNNNVEYGFNPSFKIKVPSSISSKELNRYWTKIYEKVGFFAESEGIDFILDDLSIILSR